MGLLDLFRHECRYRHEATAAERIIADKDLTIAMLKAQNEQLLKVNTALVSQGAAVRVFPAQRAEADGRPRDPFPRPFAPKPSEPPLTRQQIEDSFRPPKEA